MPKQKKNIWLYYAHMRGKTAKDLRDWCVVSLKTANHILRGGTLNKLDIASRIVKYLDIPYEEFQHFWHKPKRRNYKKEKIEAQREAINE